MTEGNYSNVGHRGPVYKGLGEMNPCDNLTDNLIFSWSVTPCSLVDRHDFHGPTRRLRQLVLFALWRVVHTCLQKDGICHSPVLRFTGREQEMSAGRRRAGWRPDVTLRVECKIHMTNRMHDTAYRVDIKRVSLATGSLKISVCVIYFPPSFQRNTGNCVERHVDMSTCLSTQYNMQNEWTYAAS
jgi:hypothetical protein